MKKIFLFILLWMISTAWGCTNPTHPPLNDFSLPESGAPPDTPEPEPPILSLTPTPKATAVQGVEYIGKTAASPNEYAQWRFDEFYAAAPYSIDWVFMGSSHAGCAFDPANFDGLGVNAFQMGMPLQLLDGTYFTLLEILNEQKPDTAVLDLYWYVLETESDEEQMRTFFDACRNEALKEQFRDEVLPLSFIQMPAQPLAIEYYKGRGYVYYGYVMKEEKYGEIAAMPYKDMKDWQPAPAQEKYLKRIASLCAERDIRLILTTAPVSNIYFSRMINYEVFHDYAAGFAEEYGLPYLDFNLRNAEEHIFDDACFFDAGHLNDRGTQTADAYFIEWLKERTLIP